MARAGARLLMLGTPNGGSWAPMQVLSGDDTFGNTLVAFGAPFQDHRRAQIDGGDAGLHPAAGRAARRDARASAEQRDAGSKLADDDLAAVREHNCWHDDELQLNAYRWGVPPQAVLDQARRACASGWTQQRDKTLPRVARQDAARRRPAPSSRPTATSRRQRRPGLPRMPPTTATAASRCASALPARRAHLAAWIASTAGCPTQKGAFAAYLELLEQRRHGSAGRRWPTRGTRGAATAPRAAPRRATCAAGRRACRGAAPAADRARPNSSRWPASARRAPARDAGAGAAHHACINGNLKFVAPAADAGPLPRLAADRHRARGRQAHRRRDGASLGAGLYPDGAGHAPGVRQHARRPRQPAAAAAPGGGDRRRPGRRRQAARHRRSRTRCARP